MHFYISFIFTCVLIYTNMKGCLSFGNPSILKTSLFVHILDISATWIQQIALFFPFGNLKCWHVMIRITVKNKWNVKNSFVFFYPRSQACNWLCQMKDETFSDRHKEITEMDNFFSFDSYPTLISGKNATSGEWTDFDPEENKVGQSNKCTYWETAEIVLLKWDLFCVVFSLLTYNLTIKNIL